MRVLRTVVDSIGQALPYGTEIVLHDLAAVPTSIVAIHGTVTGRKVGDPATDYLLRQLQTHGAGNPVPYETSLPSGRRMRSITTVVDDPAGNQVAAVCLNTDVTAWSFVKDVADSIVASDTPTTEVTETFAHDVDELGQQLLGRAILATGVPVDLMHKRHKVAVVKDLRDSGFFTLKESVDTAAKALRVTRFSIYNYLNELGAAETDAES